MNSINCQKKHVCKCFINKHSEALIISLLLGLKTPKACRKVKLYFSCPHDCVDDFHPRRPPFFPELPSFTLSTETGAWNPLANVVPRDDCSPAGFQTGGPTRRATARAASWGVGVLRSRPPTPDTKAPSGARPAAALGPPGLRGERSRAATYLKLPAALSHSGSESAREARAHGAASSRRWDRPVRSGARPPAPAPAPAPARAATRLSHPALHVKSPPSARGARREGRAPASPLGRAEQGVPFPSRHAPPSHGGRSHPCTATVDRFLSCGYPLSIIRSLKRKS